MPDLSISRALTWLADQQPDAVAVRCGRDVLTRGDLDRASNRIARRWRAEGLAVDDLVTVALPNGLDVVLATVAAWKAGATPQPLSPALPAAEREQIADLARPARVVDGPLDRCEDEEDGLLPDLAASSWKAPTSSGSTGRPKIVRAAAPARFDPEGRVATFVPREAVQLVSSPVVHAAPFVYAMRGLMTGHELVLMPEPDPVEWLRLVQEHRVTWGMVVPALMQRIRRVPQRTSYDVSSLDSVLHLGARCPEDLKRDWIDWLGPDRVVELYAGTESQGLATITGREWLAHPGSVGRATGGSAFRVVRPDGTDCADGETGEIVMRRAAATYSYVGAEPVVRDGWHTLGDAGRIEAGGWLFVGDRLDDLVVVDGVTVQPADVEAVLDAHPAVRASLVVGRGDPPVLHAVVEPAIDPDGPPDGQLDGQLDGRLDLDDLARWAADRLDGPRTPGTWQSTRTRLRDETGKARRADWR